MSDSSGFTAFVPGFDFIKNLGEQASTWGRAASAQPANGGAQAMSGMAAWVAPTFDVEELDKRINDLKSVQFWLEQNTNALKATIQALEVQKMTLSTLQGMNVNMQDLAKAFTAKMPDLNKAPEPEKPTAAEAQTPTPLAESSEKGPAVDPMQWWGSLTQQFQNIAAAAVKDVAAQAMKDKPKAARKTKAAPSKSTAAKTRSARAKKPSQTAAKSAN